ncbi:MAG: aspartyl protease family protein [Bacteroidota bacterium]|nr:aspartyl protease family protein [Bacteroidota bacterium]
MRKICLVIIFSLSHLISSAQEEFIEQSKFLTRFPFHQLTGGVVLLQATLASYPDTLNFILDSGSGGISLDSTTIKYFDITPTPSDRTIRGIAGIRKVSFVYNQKLHFPRLTIDSLNFHINDYQILTNVYGEQIDGIIGYSVLSRYIIKLNYDSSYIEFWSKGSIKYPRGGYLLRPVISTLPVHYLRVKDNESITARFLFDLGAGLNLMLSTDFIKDSAILSKKRKLYSKVAEGLGGKIDMHLTVIKEVKLGSYRFRNVPIYIFEDTYNVTSYPYLSGLIGSDILRRFNIILNYDKRDIYLTPNGHFGEPFDYAYSGIELYFVNGLIIIGDVAKDSPAEKAGVKEDDVVIAINKNFEQNLQNLKASLQNAGNQIKLIVKRGDELMEFQFKVKSILH